MHIGLGIRMSGNRGAGGGFSPNALFASSEAGDWFDPSDLSRMWQDTAGATPVTADGQTVGVILGQRQGKTRGAELFSSFNTIMSPWTGSGLGPFSIDGSHGGNADLIIDPFTLTLGKLYEFTFTISGASGNFLLFLGRSSSQAFGNGTHIVKNVCNANYIYFRATAGIAGTVTGFSVREIPGTHLVQSDAAKRPAYAFAPLTGRRNLLTKTEAFDDAVWSKGQITIAPDSGGFKLSETATTAEHQLFLAPGIPTTSGQTYTTFADVSAAERTEVYLSFAIAGIRLGSFFNLSAVTTTPDAGVTAEITALGGGIYRCRITVTANTTASRFPAIFTANAGSRTTVGDGVSGVILYRMQTELGSTATAYQKVNTAFGVTEAGVPTIHWLQFDGTNDAFASAATLDLSGTDEVTVTAGVYKASDAAEGSLVVFGDPFVLTQSFGVYSPRDAEARLGAAAIGTAYLNAQTNNAAFNAPITGIITAQFDISGDSIQGRWDGASAFSASGDLGTGNFSTQTLAVGRRSSISETLVFNGNIYFLLIRGALTSGADLTALEGFAAAKTGVTLP